MPAHLRTRSAREQRFADLAMIVKPMAGEPTVVLIPARLRSTRLPDKPLPEIGGVPMIVHVWRRACEAAVGPVVVACAEPAIAKAVEAHGGESVLTDPDLPSGTDRIFQALGRIDPERRFARVINLQGDLPTLEPTAIQACCSRSTSSAPTWARSPWPPRIRSRRRIRTWSRRSSRSIRRARAWVAPSTSPGRRHRAAMARCTTTSASTRSAATRWNASPRLPPSPLERRERLEQLRALEAGLSIGVALVDTNPLGVDTPDDLERARKELAARAV